MNNKRILFLTLGLLSLNFAIAQRCAKFGITLKSNEDIAAFKTDYPGCKTVIGDLTVSGPVSHIKDLIQIDSVLGKVSIFTGYGWDEDFKSFEGLNHLRYVGGDLNLSVNRVLTDMSDFDSLKYVGGSLLMYDNDLLKTLDGFPMLQHIGHHLDISQNDSLERIEAFKNISTINGNLMVYNNYVLTDISGLENIHFVGEVLDLHHCFKLTNLKGFKKLNKILGTANISDMPELLSLDGLENVVQIDGGLGGSGLFIQYCPKINDISAIRNVDLTKVTDLAIWYNPQLEMCSYFNICQYVRSTTTNSNISNNKGNCADKVTLKAACAISSIGSLSTNRLMLYPNPGNHFTEVNIPSEIKVQEAALWDMLGRKQEIRIEMASDKITFDTGNLQSGVYQIVLKTNNQTILLKWIKQ